MIKADIIADSINPAGRRVTTFILVYPRYILAELNTHRMFCRNSASSRAIPIHRMISSILHEPAMPVTWGQNGKGMQAKGELPKSRQWAAKLVWLMACYFACGVSWLLSKLGVHKQLANRVTEPWAHMTTILTATEFGNFFNLRCHPAAQPEFQELAFAMLDAYLWSKPKQLQPGEWHLPFADRYLTEGLTTEQLLKITTARCARVSYLNFEGNIDHAKDYKLHDDLQESGHASPFEHAAECQSDDSRHGNYVGWKPYRKLVPNENRVEFDPEKLLSQRKAT